MPKFIGIHGKAQSGKDTVAKELRRMFQRKDEYASVYAFASPVKMVASTIYHIPAWMLDDEDCKSKPYDTTDGKTLREILILVGEGLKPILGRDVWIKHIDNFVNVLSGVVILSDIRNQDELDYLKSKDAFLIKLRRNIPSSASGKAMEDGLPDEMFDLVIENQDMTRNELLDYISSLTIVEG